MWFWWVAAAVGLALVEIFTGTFYVICFAAGALGAALAAGLGASLTLQVAIFIVVSVAAVTWVWRWQRAGAPDLTGTQTGPDALIGQKALVMETLDPVTEAGIVRIGGIDWRGVLKQADAPIAPGAYVRIIGVDGNRLLVTPW